MKIFTSPHQLQKYLKTLSGSIGFVPTMGALHEGHLSLIKTSKAQNDYTVVSIFVNPTQFLQGEDLEKYPRKDEADKKICELAGVDVVFFPQVSDMYSEDEVTLEAPRVRGYVLEGASRPGHFSGVLTVVNKLLNITSPTRAYFGKKDAQQLFLIQEMVKNMFMDVSIVPVDTVRESNGLALSSRNAYLSAEQKQEALKISSSLNLARMLITKGEKNTTTIKEAIKNHLSPLQIEYVEILTYDFLPLKEVEIGNTIILVEVLVGTTRLLDNIWL
jgi:pantoate--beta-alanine ligase